MGFRFYPHLKATSCSSVSLDQSVGLEQLQRQHLQPGSFGVYCSNAGSNSRRFSAILDIDDTTSSSRYHYLWPNYSNWYTYEFNSLSGTTTLLQLQEDHGLIQLHQYLLPALAPPPTRPASTSPPATTVRRPNSSSASTPSTRS